jgi:hypothetical protein
MKLSKQIGISISHSRAEPIDGGCQMNLPAKIAILEAARICVCQQFRIVVVCCLVPFDVFNPYIEQVKYDATRT